MADSRRHAVGHGQHWITAVAAVLGAISLAAVASAFLTFVVARTVVSPQKQRPEKTPIISVDAAGQHLTLGRDADSELPGRYSLFFSSGAGHARIGEIVRKSESTVTRRLLGVDSGVISDARRGRLSGWFFVSPADLGLPFSDVQIETELGPAPAWLIPAAQPTSRWVIQVHGRAVRRTETLRAVPVFRDAGYTSLLVSYRNDGEAPTSPDGCYGLGDTEWRDIQAAIRFAACTGATDIILMGWSMGGATILQTLARAAESSAVRGIVLDSPVIDWRSALRFQGELLRVPTPMSSAVLRVLGHRLASRIIGLESPIDLDRLDFVRRSSELTVPILLMHSDGDRYVPIAPSAELADRRPDIVTFERFSDAGHTKLWNHDPLRWNGALARWLRATQRGSDDRGEPGDQGETVHRE